MATRRVDRISGEPDCLKQRTAIIYRPARPATQSGTAQTGHWRMCFDAEKTRWPSRVLQWTASRDAVQGVVLKFDSSEAAVAFAERNGWPWRVLEDVGPRRGALEIIPKSYADNFGYTPGKLKLIRTK